MRLFYTILYYSILFLNIETAIRQRIRQGGGSDAGSGAQTPALTPGEGRRGTLLADAAANGVAQAARGTRRGVGEWTPQACNDKTSQAEMATSL